MTQSYKKSTGRRVFACRVDSSTPEAVEAIAKDLGCFRIDGDNVLKGACGIMLDFIAQGRLQVVPSTQDLPGGLNHLGDCG